MLSAVEILRTSDQADLAHEVAERAQAVARKLEAIRDRRLRDERDQQAERRAQQESQWRAEVLNLLNDLHTRVQHLSQDVTELRQQVDQQRRRAEDARFASVNLTGRWLMTLPAGFKYEAGLRPQEFAGLYYLNVRGNLAGIYRHQGKMLSVEVPRDKRLTEFVWEFQDENLLLLTAAPATAKIGSDYRGATLRRWPKGDDQSPNADHEAEPQSEPMTPPSDTAMPDTTPARLDSEAEEIEREP
jgi:hypothetical protein